MKLNKYLIICMLFSISIFGQTSLIGKIRNDKGAPIVGASVYLDSINTNTISNAVGYFKVDVPKGIKKITLYAAKYGYLTTEYNNEERLSFVFIEPKGKGEVTADKDGMDETINSLNVRSDNNISSYRNIYEYIDGKVAGVTVSNSNEIVIRGGSSWDLSNEPLFVVDGVIVSSIDQISPMDIDRINILKGVDASIYGSRGSNGVLEIITKE